MNAPPHIRAEIEARLGITRDELDAERDALRQKAADVVADVRADRLGETIAEVVRVERGEAYLEWLRGPEHAASDRDGVPELMRAVAALRVKTALRRMDELSRDDQVQSRLVTLALIRFIADAERSYPGVTRMARAQIERAERDPEFREAEHRAQLTLAVAAGVGSRVMGQWREREATW